MKYVSRRAFTLIEIAISIGILSFGLTGIVIVYMTSLKWAEEIRIDLTAAHTAQAALFDAGLILDDNDIPAGYSNTLSVAKGWLNDYYVVRTVDDSITHSLPATMGTYTSVRIEIYYGGTDADGGRKVYEMSTDQLLPQSYNP